MAVPVETSVPRVITLVHGTWARDAPWTKPDSRLSRTLTASLPGSELRLARWNGLNSPTGRRNGGDRVRTDLRALIDENPEARHYVIAHSHGGNVVRYALKGLDRKLKNRICGIVCLATPFISCKGREDLGERLGRIRKDILHNKGIFLFGAILLFSLVFEPLLQHEAWAVKVLGGLILTIYGVFWFGDFWREPLARRIEDRLYEAREATVERFSFSDPPNPPLLSLRPARDEPSRWLKLVGRLASIPFKLRRFYLWMCFVLGAGAALWFQVVSPLRARGESLLAFDLDSLYLYAFTILLGGTVGVAAGFVLAELLRWLIPNLTQGRFYGLGRSPWHVHAVAEIRTDKPPAEFEDLEDVDVTTPRRRWWQLWKLRHSAIYGTDRALELIVKKIDPQASLVVPDG